jgi:hypothetical protein
MDASEMRERDLLNLLNLSFLEFLKNFESVFWGISSAILIFDDLFEIFWREF